ncbi:deleted in lung and esophageal cancer protein 1 [Hemitrygon akajei]|uniref:deleted in lung and esophageal cancer protein 1 n=1 Tax=Hemitrygon akajei TaxID=2704970 RepID=UPI003BF98F81
MNEEEAVEENKSPSSENINPLPSDADLQNPDEEITKDACKLYKNDTDRITSSEPFMYRHRPTSEKAQDISYLLASIFKEVYTGDVIGKDIMKNLMKSKGGDNAYHEKFVQQLQEINEEYKRRITEADTVEKHIIQARARAAAAEEKALNRIKEESGNSLTSVGLPPEKSMFMCCVDSELLKKHNLIVPEDYITERPVIRKAAVPAGKPTVHYSELTFSFKQQTSQSPVDDGYLDICPPKELWTLQGDISSLTLSPSPAESTSLKKSSLQEEKFKKRIWRDEPPMADRIQAREDMMRLERCHNFLKNPRYLPPHQGGKSLIIPKKKVEKMVGDRKIFVEESDPAELIPVFLANPPVILFTDYKVGQVYETNVELRNMTSNSRHLRIIPPSTSFFSIGLGRFPGEGGIVAPGMSCQYTVRFAPDSPAEYEDFLLVETQMPYPLVIPIEARRPPPILTLPGTLDCGYCLVGGVKFTEFLCKNEGYSSGYFCIMPKRMWPTTNFRSVAVAGFLDIAPFAIRPAVFELQPGQALMLEIAFLPTTAEAFFQTVTMVCDNCQVKDFVLTGTGQQVALHFISISGGESMPALGECRDITAEHFVCFEATNPHVYSQKVLTLRNATHVNLPFCWQILKPNLMCAIPGESIDHSNLEYDPDLKSAFHICPEDGDLEPHHDHEFIITYFPQELKEYHSVFYLVLRDVPESANGNECNAGARKNNLERSLKAISASVSNIIAMEIEVKGYTDPFQVLLKPYAILIPGENYMNMTLKRYFQMWNNSKSAICFEWESVHDTHILEVIPPCGTVEADSYCELELLLTGGKPEKMAYHLQCHIRYHEEPVTLCVEATFVGPQVCIDLPSLDFCLVQFGTRATRSLYIKNTCQLPASWCLQESAACLSERGEEASQFTFEPSSGELPPLSDYNVNILFTPTKCQSLKTVLELKVENGNTSYIAVQAEVQEVQVCLLSCTIIFDEIYIGVPARKMAKLFNQTMLPAKCSWGEVHKNYAHQCRVKISPACITLGPNEEAAVYVELTVLSADELNGATVSCTVEEMKEPLLLELYAKPKGLNITYSIPTDDREESDLLVLDFSEMMVHNTMKRKLLITNNTAIAGSFSLEVEYFSSCSPFPPPISRSPHGSPSSHSRTPLLKRTVSLTEGPSKSQDQLQREFADAVLCHRKGAAFVLQPSTGILEPYQQQVIEITAYANMWGDYNDWLICRVAELDPTKIPIQLSVKGVPIYFKVLGPQKDNQKQGPMVRFGTHISGGDTVSRSLRLINAGPCDIRLDWETYNVESMDLQLVDLLITYGQEFPLKDESGNEIISTSALSSESAPSRNWDLIPNSAESSSLGLQTQYDKEEEEEPVDEENAMRTDDLISVVLRVHEGLAVDYPYYVTPRQTVVPACGCATINVSFTPLTLNGKARNVECKGFAFGYLSLDDKVAFGIPGKVKRDQGYGTEPLRIDFAATVKAAMLTVEIDDDDDDNLMFYAAASDLIPDGLNGKIQREVLRTRGLKLTNPMETPLCFHFLLQRPFCVLDVDPKNTLKSSSSDREENTKLLVLHPRQHMHVTVAFCSSWELLSFREIMCTEKEPKLVFEQDLVIEYNNKSTQLIPLYAHFFLPNFEVSTEDVDFGTCLVGQTRSKDIFLLNKSRSKSYWTAVLAPSHGQEDESVFQICPTCGILEAHAIQLSTSRTALQISFTARDSKTYKASVTIQGILGERPLTFMVQGRGSIDERFEATYTP